MHKQLQHRQELAIEFVELVESHINRIIIEVVDSFTSLLGFNVLAMVQVSYFVKLIISKGVVAVINHY